MNPPDVLDAWSAQLAKEVSPYLTVARTRGHAVQVVLFLDASGRVGTPKVTLTTGGKGKPEE